MSMPSRVFEDPLMIYGKRPYKPKHIVVYLDSLATVSISFKYSSMSFAPINVISRFFPSKMMYGTVSMPLLVCSRISVLVACKYSDSALMNALASASSISASFAAAKSVSRAAGCFSSSKYCLNKAFRHQYQHLCTLKRGLSYN